MNAPQKHHIQLKLDLVLLTDMEAGAQQPSQFDVERAVFEALNDYLTPDELGDKIRDALEDDQGRVPDVILDYTQVRIMTEMSSTETHDGTKPVHLSYRTAGDVPEDEGAQLRLEVRLVFDEARELTLPERQEVIQNVADGINRQRDHIGLAPGDELLTSDVYVRELEQ